MLSQTSTFAKPGPVLLVNVASSHRMEYLLEEAPSDKVVDYLICLYPRVRFTRHPTMNGFYALGTKEEYLAIKRALVDLDRPEPWPDLPASTRYVADKTSAEEAFNRLRHWMPEVVCRVDGDGIVCEGPAVVRGPAIRVLTQLNHKTEVVEVQRETLANAPKSLCETSKDYSPFACPGGNCGGFLHLTGLRNGDEVLPYLRESQYGPFWVVHRDGAETNIFVDIR